MNGPNKPPTSTAGTNNIVALPVKEATWKEWRVEKGAVVGTAVGGSWVALLMQPWKAADIKQKLSKIPLQYRIIFHDAYYSHGLRGLYSGMSVGFFRAPGSQVGKSLALSIVDKYNLSTVQKAFVFSGIMTFLLTPIDRVLTLFISNTGVSRLLLMKELLSEGPKSLYKGSGPNALKFLAEGGVVWATMTFKEYWKEHLNYYLYLLCYPGIVGGAAAIKVALTNVFDVYRVVLQAVKKGELSAITSWTGHVQNYGIQRSFGAGFWARWCLNVIGVATSLLSIEISRCFHSAQQRKEITE